MINVEARREAVDIARTGNTAEATCSKVALYGLLGYVIGSEAFEELSLEGHTIESFRDLKFALKYELTRTAHTAMRSVDQEKTRQLGSLADGRNTVQRTLVRFPNFKHKPRELLLMNLGIETAAATELTVLRTVARNLAEGQTISQSGLLESARVATSYAMTGIDDLDQLADDREAWPRAEGGDGELVFRRDRVVMTHEHGLQMAGAPVREPFSASGEPTVGCPAMLVPGIVNRLHEVAVAATLQAELLDAA